MTPPADEDVTLGRGLQLGDHHYRAFVDFPGRYDVGAAAMQFSLLTALGLREDHSLLDIGCGSLRGPNLRVGGRSGSALFEESQSALVDAPLVENQLGSHRATGLESTVLSAASARAQPSSRRQVLGPAARLCRTVWLCLADSSGLLLPLG
jgi:hypothetical protein